MLTINLSGRIDAENAGITAEEISSQLAKFPGETPTFDAANLEYISSAGLMTLLKFRKRAGKNLDVINASNEAISLNDRDMLTAYHSAIRSYITTAD